MRDHRLTVHTSARMPKLVLSTLAIGLALAGCALGPNYRRPSTTLPDRYDAAAPMAVDGASRTLQNDWWKMFGDEQLNALVTASINNNPNVRLAFARIDEARGTLREANSAFFPEISYQGVGERARSGVAGGSVSGTSTAATGRVGYGNFFSASAPISYELDLWGAIRRASEGARANLLGSQYARDVTVLALASSTAQAYFTLRSLDAQIKVTQSTLQAVGESLDIAQKRLQAGYSSALDYAQAETLRAQTQVDLRELRRQRAVQEHQLGNLTSNLSLHIDAGDLDTLPVPASPPPGMPSTLLEQRPDVAQAEQEIVTSNAQIGVATAALFPTFSLTGAYGGQSFQLSDLLKAPFRYWNFGLGISGPIFAGGKYFARLDEAKARNDEQIASYQSTVEGAFQEVANALTNVAESNAAEPEVMVQVDAARRTLRLSQLRYKAGYSGYLDVLDATRQANIAELTLVQNRASRLNYSVDLFRALGGGWSDRPAPVGTADLPAASASPSTAVSSR